jgi:glycine/serine hydroxymethyltransferase
MTTRWVKEYDTKKIASFIHEAIQNRNDENILNKIHQEVSEFCLSFPIPSV